nr:Deoxyuridine 5'-triphosphate nucleotidohydrolase [Pandoravirus aubagnensis]
MEQNLPEYIAVTQQQAHDEVVASFANGDTNSGSDDNCNSDGSSDGNLTGAQDESHVGVVEALDHSTKTTLVKGEKKRKRGPAGPDDPTMVLKCKRMHADAALPKRATADAAGYDLCAVQEATVPARGQATVPIGIAVAIPQGYYGRVAPRSSLASKGIDVGAGVVDADYRGQVKVILFNHSDTPYVAHVGDHIAQLIIERIATPEAQWVDDLDDTDRGDGGFGSTGR